MSTDKQAAKLYQELLSLKCLDKEKLTTALGQYIEQDEPIEFIAWMLKNDRLTGEQAEIIQRKILQSPQDPSITYPALSEAFTSNQTFPLQSETASVFASSQLSTIDMKPDNDDRGISDTTMQGVGSNISQDSLNETIGDRFKIEAPVGEGAMGIVYKAYDSLLERTVALKFPRHIQGCDMGRFLQEGKAATRLRHPHIVGVYDIQKQGETYFLVMDFVEGSTLKEIIQGGPLGIERTISIIIKIGGAIDYAHKQGIIHRDLKPANIIMTGDSEPMIMDFGIAKIMGEDFTHTGACIGTPTYMSPEQASGEAKKVDARSDVYSLGAIFYELLAGRPPFLGSNALSVMHSIIYKDPEPLGKIEPGISHELDSICMKLLEKNMEKRYQTVAIFVEDLGRFSGVISQEQLAQAPNSAPEVGEKKRFRLDRKTSEHQVEFPELKGDEPSLPFAPNAKSESDSKFPPIVEFKDEANLPEEGSEIEFSEKSESSRVESSGAIFSNLDIQLPSEQVVELESAEIPEKESKRPVTTSFQKPASHQALKETRQLSLNAEKPPGKTARHEIPIAAKKFPKKWFILAAVGTVSAITLGIVLFFALSSKPQPSKPKDQKLADEQGWFAEKLSPYMKRGINRGEYIWAIDGSIMVYVPDGKFWHRGKNGKFIKKRLPAFYIDKYELSNRQYQKFLEMTGRTSQPKVKAKFKRPQQPVVGISWQEAYQYAVWAKKRLPNRYEWEKAARGGLKIPNRKDIKGPISLRANPLEKRRYPWGNEKPVPHLANYKSVEDGYGKITAPKGSFPSGKSPYGCQDMAGNVWEWYDSNSIKKACRGGSWNSSESRLEIGSYFQPSTKRSINIGVRFALSASKGE